MVLIKDRGPQSERIVGTEVSYEQARPGLCRLSTGSRFNTRRDSIDRATVINPDSIPGEARNPEALIWEEFEAVRPKVLNAPLLAVSGAVRGLPTLLPHARHLNLLQDRRVARQKRRPPFSVQLPVGDPPCAHLIVQRSSFVWRTMNAVNAADASGQLGDGHGR